MNRVLVTRPREDAEGIAQALERRGFEVVLEPLLDIHVLPDAALPLAGVQGILATSANGVRALAANGAPRDLPVWAVGPATAEKARELGFSAVESAGGDVVRLAELVNRRVDPARGALLHAAGTKVAGDLSGDLERRGFEVRRAVLYEARTAEALTPGLVAAMRDGLIGLALFFSPRTAATFVRLADAARIGETCRTIAAGALSAAVAEQLASLAWRRTFVARTPDQAALLAAVDADRGC